MARKGITEKDVASAIKALKDAGLTQPSVRMIHQKLGTGSLTTIVRHKNAIEAEQRSTDGQALPDSIQVKLTEIAHTLWTDCAETADAIIEANKHDTNERVEQYHAEMEEAVARAGEEAANANNLKQQLKEAEKALSKSQAANQLLEQDLAKALARTRELDQSAALQERDSKALTQRLAKMEDKEAAIAQQRTVEQKQQAQERERWEKTREQLQKTLDKQSGKGADDAKTIAVLQTRLKSVKALNENDKQEIDRLKKDNKHLHLDQKALSKKIGSLESELAAEKRAGRLSEKTWKAKFTKQEKEITRLTSA